MEFVKRRLVLSMVALSPGAIIVSIMDLDNSATLLFGAIGAFSLAALALSAKADLFRKNTRKRPSEHISLLLPSALSEIRAKAPDPRNIRDELHAFVTEHAHGSTFLNKEQQIAMVLSQIMARWNKTDVHDLTDDQSRELWLVDRLMRATPAEAGPLAFYFAAPEAMLTIRDSLAAPVLT